MIDNKNYISYLYSLPSFETNGISYFNNSLNKISYLCNLFDNPQKKFISIHVGGTNGKGSVAHMISSILQVSNINVGLYTSPHIVDLRERIKTNDNYIDENYIVLFLKRNKYIFDYIKPTFFELITLIAFSYFADKKISIAIIEVGMGGRLDATNVIDPLITIITNIGYDHTDILGNTLQKIAYEKSGIIKPNSTLILSESNSLTDYIFIEKANKYNIPILIASDEFQLYDLKNHYFSVYKKNKKLYDICPDIKGYYQKKNIKAVLTAINVLNYKLTNISHNSIIEGLRNIKKNTGLKCRYHVISYNPLTILDIAHNIDGINNIVPYILQYKKIHIVLGIMKDKNLYSIMNVLPKNAIYYYCYNNNNKRMLHSKILMHIGFYFKLKGNCYYSSINAYINAIKNYQYGDVILVTGSSNIMSNIIKYYQ